MVGFHFGIARFKNSHICALLIKAVNSVLDITRILTNPRNATKMNKEKSLSQHTLPFIFKTTITNNPKTFLWMKFRRDSIPFYLYHTIETIFKFHTTMFSNTLSTCICILSDSSAIQIDGYYGVFKSRPLPRFYNANL